MIYFDKLFKLPGPKDLSMSDSNVAMPSRFFPNNKTEKTWEDYYEYLAQTYPVRFFFASVLPQFFVDFWHNTSRPFKKIYNWFVSHAVPSRRYHWLDLRQPDYRYGWCDTDRRMVFAMFNLLKEFVELEGSGYYVPSEEDVAKDDGIDYNYSGLKRQLDQHKEYMAIYNWWIKERAMELAEEDAKLTLWSDAKHVFADNEKELWEELQTVSNRNDAKLEEMLHRLITVRHCLWT